METKVVHNQKITKILYIFNLGCVSHPEKATSSCFLTTKKLFSIFIETMKTKVVYNLHHKMYESTRKNYS